MYRATVYDGRRNVLERGPDGRVLKEEIVFRERRDNDGNFIQASKQELDKKMRVSPLFRNIFDGLRSHILEECNIVIAVRTIERDVTTLIMIRFPHTKYFILPFLA